eukprot:TRINITY_DN14240_c0_g1_i1.p1 TRINITY_DN14240_c0_g1~~TRINITY_DN14240_c0_g1_i1.p1  ORF type:complete len:843 (+),score=233.46 TRINITY_DN14240_c0_g1_i1:74-2602(+)
MSLDRTTKESIHFVFETLVGLDVVIPDTLVVEEDNSIRRLYKYDKGGGVQCYESTWSEAAVLKYYQPMTVDANTVFDIVAVFITGVPKLSVHYLSSMELEAFLATVKPPGLLQKFTPRTTNHQLTQIIWTPFMMVSERRINTNPLLQMSVPLEDRVVTDKQHPATKEVPLHTATQKQLENVCRLICNAAMKKASLVLTRVNLYFLTCKPIVFMFCSSVSAYEVSKPAKSPKPKAPVVSSMLQIDAPDDHDRQQRDVLASCCTTPAPSLAGSDEDDMFDIQVAEFQAVGGGLMVYTTRADAKRPDSYLIVPACCASGDAVAKPSFTESQKAQVNTVNRGIASATRRPPKNEPTASKISRYAATEKVLGREVPRNGVHALRRKYNAAAQTALLQGENVPLEVPVATVDVIPKLNRRHIVKDRSVVGSATPATLHTRPASAPASKLLSTLQAIDKSENTGARVPACIEEIENGGPTLEEMNSAAKRVAVRKKQAAKEKERYAIPSLEVPSTPARAMSAGRGQRDNMSLKKKLARDIEIDSVLAVREQNWDPSTQADMTHLPKKHPVVHRGWRPAGRAASTTPSFLSSLPSSEVTSPTGSLSPVRTTRNAKPIPRYPLLNSNDYHQSVSEMMRKKGRGKGNVMEALFGKGEEVQEAAVEEFVPEEVKQLGAEKAALEERAVKLEAIRQKRQKMHQERECAKLRTQYSTLESKYFNETAIEYMEDILYGIYSQALERRTVPSKLHTFTLPPDLPFLVTLAPLLSCLGFTSIPGDDLQYSLPADKVLVSNVMGSLAEYKVSIQKIFRQKNMELMKRLKNLITPENQEDAIPLYTAAKVILREFADVME